jgi:hypothetical protein
MKLIFKTSIALIAVCASVFSQNAATSEISGTVRDSSGAAIAGAKITATQTGTGLTRVAESSSDGSYVLPSLPTGPWKLEISKDGFNTYVQNGIVLQVASNPVVDATLQIGQVSQQVEIEASAAMVETRSSGVGQVVDQERVVDLPLNGRLATDLIYLAGASAQAPNADLVSAKNYPGEAPISVAGGLANGTTYLLDGGTHNDQLNNLNLPLPFPDALQEFKVETSALPAQYGQHSGGAVNAVTRSGSNTYHGDAFEFVRNYIFNARNWFAPARDSLKRNQFGGTFGGPVKKDRLFFFLGYQGTLVRSNPSQTFSFVPTPAQYAGNFSTPNPGCSIPQLKDPTTGTPYANNQIPVSQFSPIALKMLSAFPATSDPCGRVFFGIGQNQDEHEGIARVDYTLSQSQSLYLRYFLTHSLQPSTYDGKDPLTMTLAGADDMVNSAVVGHTWIINPGTVNAFHATFNRSSVTKFQGQEYDASTLGINMTTLVPGHIVATVSGGGLYTSSVFSYPSRDPTYDYQLSDDFSLIHGNHQFGFGFNGIYILQNVFGPLNGDGNFTFNGSASGSPLADLFLGTASNFSQSNLQFDTERYTYIGLYAQDAWKINRRLTANIGLRWEPYIGGRMATNEVTHFDPTLFTQNVHSTVYPNAPAGLLFPGDSGFHTGSRPSNINWKDFAPRVGIVYDPMGNGRMTIRASWGIFYDIPHTLFAYGFVQEPPWGESIARPNAKLADPWGPQWSGGAAFAGGNPFPIALNKNFTFPTFATYANYPTDLKVTYLEQWNLSIQKQIGANWLASASYLGNNTIHLWGNNPINSAVLQPGATVQNENQRRPLYLQDPVQGSYYGTIQQLDFGSTASYNALLLSLQHRLADHFTVLANYTYSHCITDPFTSELDNTTTQYSNPQNRRFDRGNCVLIDHRQLTNISLVAETPKFSGRMMQRLAGDWKVSAIARYQTGAYYSVTTGADTSLLGAGTDRGNQILSDPYCAVKSQSCWLNPAAFSNITGSALGTLGNVGAASIAGPGAFTLDFGLFRLFPVREKQSVEFRWEVFNAPNIFRPGNPLPGTSPTTIGTALNSPATFGKLQLAADPRIMQFALKYVF